MSHAIKVIEQQPSQLSREFAFTPEQQEMIRASFLNGANESEARVLLELARVRRLNPITGQIHFVKRWNSARNCETWAAQVGIDGFRAIAQRTGLYNGQDEAEFELDKAGRIVSCRVKVYRKDWERPAVGVAYWSEYAQMKKDGTPTAMWASKPRVMLSKCAESIALRKAFPDDLGDLYTPDEQPDEVEVNEAPKAAAVEDSTNRITAAVQRKAAQLAPPSPVVVPAPKASPRRIVIQDGPPDEPEGYADSLVAATPATQRDRTPLPPSGVTAWYEDKKGRFHKGQSIEDVGDEGLQQLLWLLDNGDGDPKFAAKDAERRIAIVRELEARGVGV